MAITDSELREIYSNAPVEKDTFEVLALKADWFTQDYYIQHTFTEGVEVPLEDGVTYVIADYAPADIGQASSNADLTYERTIVIQQINDLISSEAVRFNPDTDGLPVLESRGYVMYRDGTVSQLKTPVIKLDITKLTRNEMGASIAASSKPVNVQATGELATIERVPMYRGFL